MNRLSALLAGAVAAISLFFCSGVAMAGEFVDVPVLDSAPSTPSTSSTPSTGGTSSAPSTSSAPKRSALKMRFVTYDGSTNGQMVVELANTGSSSERFTAEGLYFVPKGDPEKAPQRLGAAGPIVIREGKRERTELNGIVLRPGETKRVRLEVFCIDSHRSSPDRTTSFDVSPERLPSELRTQISAGSQKIIHQNHGDVESSKGAIQSYMWETRDANWVRLRGERKREKAPPSERVHPRNHEQNLYQNADGPTQRVRPAPQRRR